MLDQIFHRISSVHSMIIDWDLFIRIGFFRRRHKALDIRLIWLLSLKTEEKKETRARTNTQTSILFWTIDKEEDEEEKKQNRSRYFSSNWRKLFHLSYLYLWSVILLSFCLSLSFFCLLACRETNQDDEAWNVIGYTSGFLVIYRKINKNTKARTS